MEQNKMKMFFEMCGLIIVTVLGVTSAEMRAIAVLRGDTGVHGNVTFLQKSCGDPVHIDISVEGLRPGAHGFHVHEKGDLSNGCLSTGSHFNPDKLEHGAPNDEVRHVGDLGNIVANTNGSASTKFTDSVISLNGMKSIIGRAVVVHDHEDDLGRTLTPDSKKTGNAGGRVVCGVIGIISEDKWECSDKSAAADTHQARISIFSVLVVVGLALRVFM